MALNSSGAISLGGTTAGQSVNLELGQAAGATITMNDTNLRTLFGIASGQISLSQGYGKSSYNINSTRGIFAQASIVTQISFATETSSTITATTNVITPCTANNPTAGYFGGGTSGPRPSALLNKFAFSTNTVSPLSALPTPKSAGAGHNSSTKGYFGGGVLASVAAPGNIASLDFGVVTFATDTTSTSAAGIVQARVSQMAGVQSQTRGYLVGGAASNLPSAQIDGVNYATDTAIDPAGGLVQGRSQLAGFNSSTKGYFGGGWVAPYEPVSQVDGFNFTTEAGFDIAAGLAQARFKMGGVNSSTKGYFGGGAGPWGMRWGATTQVDGIVFSSETFTDYGVALSSAVYDSTAIQDSNN